MCHRHWPEGAPCCPPLLAAGRCLHHPPAAQLCGLPALVRPHAWSCAQSPPPRRPPPSPVHWAAQRRRPCHPAQQPGALSHAAARQQAPGGGAKLAGLGGTRPGARSGTSHAALRRQVSSKLIHLEQQLLRLQEPTRVAPPRRQPAAGVCQESASALKPGARTMARRSSALLALALSRPCLVTLVSTRLRKSSEETSSAVANISSMSACQRTARMDNHAVQPQGTGRRGRDRGRTCSSAMLSKALSRLSCSASGTSCPRSVVSFTVVAPTCGGGAPQLQLRAAPRREEGNCGTAQIGAAFAPATW